MRWRKMSGFSHCKGTFPTHTDWWAKLIDSNFCHFQSNFLYYKHVIFRNNQKIPKNRNIFLSVGLNSPDRHLHGHFCAHWLHCERFGRVFELNPHWIFEFWEQRYWLKFIIILKWKQNTNILETKWFLSYRRCWDELSAERYADLLCELTFGGGQWAESAEPSQQKGTIKLSKTMGTLTFLRTDICGQITFIFTPTLSRIIKKSTKKKPFI